MSCSRCGGPTFDAADTEDQRQGIVHAYTCLLCANVAWVTAPQPDRAHAVFHGGTRGRPRKAKS